MRSAHSVLFVITKGSCHCFVAKKLNIQGTFQNHMLTRVITREIDVTTCEIDVTTCELRVITCEMMGSRDFWQEFF